MCSYLLSLSPDNARAVFRVVSVKTIVFGTYMMCVSHSVLVEDDVGDNTGIPLGVSVDLKEFRWTETVPFRLTETPVIDFNTMGLYLGDHYLLYSSRYVFPQRKEAQQVG